MSVGEGNHDVEEEDTAVNEDNNFIVEGVIGTCEYRDDFLMEARCGVDDHNATRKGRRRRKGGRKSMIWVDMYYFLLFVR